ncbi:hypothetical protein AUEXF2481DRAFT_190441 [Aureobasidium subglaciale EXF-2481]|uniref:Uncharacterized protein n=1 Tax=Aureobasidium subglaciale (strain EXF-2481) TaxID=1043005 RepID=A0A074ZMT4_AURSE|nr:uncharacterized protein AUEXF2481DRAFT_190441 [Aureobasidium subglaciale EXF-2481]KEQ99676.1 hypothetical protein AUEXF2481DRAFT_190441 [Aureobasidium subglaciale EXF-2481]
MQLPFVNLFLITSTLSCLARTDTVTDAIQLQNLASSTADTIFASLNGTAYLNTSNLVLRVSAAVQGADSMMMANVSSPGIANVSFNDAYFNYADAMLYLANTVQRRGLLFHSELNLPVYQALQGLSSAVSAYGHDLTAQRLVQRNSTVRTLTIGSAIVRAQTAWSNNVNYPGKREIMNWSG